MFDLTPYLTALVMFVGILVGTLISPRIQQRMGIEHGRKDLLFKKKLEYFEGIVNTIEKNKRIYYKAISRIEFSKSNKEIYKIIEELKKGRENFLILASPIYFNTKNFSEKIVSFVRIEKDIFNKIPELKKIKEKKRIMDQLKENLKSLNRRGEEIVLEMKKELSR